MGLSPKKFKAINALLVSPTVNDAAEEVGVGRSTLFRWMQEPEFEREYRKARGMVLRQSIASLQRICSKAVQTLSEIMSNEDAPASARVSAARTALELAVKTTEMDDLIARIESLERAAVKK